MPEQKAHRCGRCWASTRIAEKKYFCMFPRCFYRKGAEPDEKDREGGGTNQPVPTPLLWDDYDEKRYSGLLEEE